MAYRDLREFMEMLEQDGQLVRIAQELEGGYELSALSWELAERQGPAVIIKVRGFEIPVVMNVHGTLARNCLGMGLTPKQSFEENYLQIRSFMAALLTDRSQWLKPELVSKAPCQEIVLTGEDINLYRLPIFKWSPLDGGPYIAMTNVITRDPDQKYGQNTGMYRVMLHDEKSTGVMCCATQDIGIHLAQWRAKGCQTMPIAIALGVDPVINIVSTTKMASFTEDEFELAGGIRKAPVEMVQARTVDLKVPARAEIVIEGELDITKAGAKQEGPFAEWMGYYEEPMMLPVLHVTAITMRRDAHYQTCILGHPNNEGEMIRMPVIQANNYNVLKRNVVGFRDFWAPHKSRGYKVVVQISKRFPGWGMQAGLAALSSGQGMAAANYVVVVDEDVNIYDQEEVELAIATRVDPAKDVLILPRVGVYPLNPAASGRADVDPTTGYTEYSFIGKMVIDATKKLASEDRRPTGTPVTPDAQALEAIRAKWTAFGLENW